MNTFYHFEGRVFETEELAKVATKDYVSKKIDIIETDKDFDKFYECFTNCRFEGNSIADSIDWAK